MKIGVLAGGNSAERDVSLSSGKAISDACKDLGYDVLSLDSQDDIKSLIPDLLSVDVVFNGLHGGDGENGVIPGFLQSLGVRFTGSGNESSAICMDKRVSKALVHRKDILTPNWIALSSGDDVPMDHDLGYPVVVKPNSQGSTIGLTIVQDQSELADAVALARQYDSVVLIEAFIAGREITISIIGDTAYPIVEIVPSHELYDYECKYTQGMTDYFCPANLSEEITKSIQASALKIHKLLGCRHYSRVDFRLDETNKVWFLEVNTLPGMTETSLVPKSAAAAGLSFPELIQTIINEALED
jgi:D-alanine-D-alanine ligase